MKNRTFLHQAIELTSMGSHALEWDLFTDNFKVSKTNKSYPMVLRNLSIFIRYFILVPIRAVLFVVLFGVLSIFFVICNYFNLVPLVDWLFLIYMKLFGLVLGIRARHHGEKTKISEPHIYVCNHTSFLDFIVLSSHRFPHAVLSEYHGGLFGFIFNFLISKNGSICFKRAERRDKAVVKEKIIKHIRINRAPMLVFPEGTCVNNKQSVLFQKGAFEMDTYVVPVALKYKKVLMDPYWNRRKHGFIAHLVYLVTRWRIDVDVHWLAPVKLNKHETPIGFSHRIKGLISDKAMLKNTNWAGYFKSQLIYADLDILKVAVKNVLLAVDTNTLDELGKLDYKKNDFLSHYSRVKAAKGNKIYFDSVTYEQFYVECCNEFLRIKGLPQKKRELVLEKIQIKNDSHTPKLSICTCRL